MPKGIRVLTWLAGADREVLHPSIQVGQYKMYLEDTHTAFHESAFSSTILNACAYLHNYNYYKEDVLFSPKFANYLENIRFYRG